MFNIKNKLPFVIGVGYIMFIVGISYGWIGDAPTCSPDPYTWLDTLNITATLATLFLLGLWANAEVRYHER